jgi:hypothetical protein
MGVATFNYHSCGVECPESIGTHGGCVNRREFRRLAELRLGDAQALLTIRRHSAAYYLAGYAVECGLKACIAKRFSRYEFPPRNAQTLYTHRIADLVVGAQLQASLANEKSVSTTFNQNWSIVSAWSEESRYQTWSKQQASTLVNAITDVPDGVMAWIKQHW